VGGEQDRGPGVAERPDRGPGLLPGGGVEPGGRLVEEQQPRPADDPERQVEPALLAAGQLPDRAPLEAASPARPMTSSTSRGRG
jgi:hypothetical protein